MSKSKVVAQVFASRAQIVAKCELAATWINQTFQGQTPVIVGLLRSCVPFYGEVLARVDVPCEMDFVRVDRSAGKNGNVATELGIAPSISVKGRAVIVLAAKVETGASLSFLIRELHQRGASAVRTIVMVKKSGVMDYPVVPNITMFECDERPLCGFGIAHNDLDRTGLDIVYAPSAKISK